MSYAFDADTRVEPLADGVLGAAITDRWNALGERPNGGHLLGICLQALRRVLPFPDPLTVAAFFLRPARPGRGAHGGPGWAQGRPSGDPRVQLWLRFRDGLELTAHVRARPASGWLACRVSTRYVIGGYHEEDFEVWDSRGALVAQSRQLALLPAP